MSEHQLLTDALGHQLLQSGSNAVSSMIEVIAVLAQARAENQSAADVLAALEVTSAEQLGKLLELVAGVALIEASEVAAHPGELDRVEFALGFAGPRQLAAHREAAAAGTTLYALLDDTEE